MSRSETQIIKGIALLMMLWLHLFSNAETTLACKNLVQIGDLPLATLITRACPPVGFFVFCGGYGLYYTYRKGKDKHYLTRIAKLFIAYWLILLVCIPLCLINNRTSLPMDLQSILYNITAIKVSWDYPCWFLCPYALLSLSYPLLFPLYDHFRLRYIIPIVFCIQILCMAIIHFYGTSIDIWPYCGILICYFEFLFLFFCGATVLRCDMINVIRKRVCITHKEVFRFLQVLSIIILVILKILLNSAVDGGLYTLGIVFLILVQPPNPHGFPAKFLEEIGKHSMNIWMIHFMLYALILHDVIFACRFPILIFVELLLLSYLSSMLMNVVLKPIFRVLKV